MNTLNNTLADILKQSFSSKTENMSLSEKKQYFEDEAEKIIEKRKNSIVDKKYHFRIWGKKSSI